MILLTVVMKASDVHVMPALDAKGMRPSVEIRCRVDGVLHPVATGDPVEYMLPGWRKSKSRRRRA